MSADAEFVCGDVRDRQKPWRRPCGVWTGWSISPPRSAWVGQSLPVSRYVDANTGGTGVLLDIIANDKTDVGRIVVASSMSIYGEGAYKCSELGSSARQAAAGVAAEGPPVGSVLPDLCSSRGLARSRQRRIRHCCRRRCTPSPRWTRSCCRLSIGAAYGVGVVALRYFNAYGPRQALSNPYTGVAAIFSGRLLNGRAPLAFEDGQQLRDFVHVRDIWPGPPRWPWRVRRRQARRSMSVSAPPSPRSPKWRNSWPSSSASTSIPRSPASSAPVTSATAGPIQPGLRSFLGLPRRYHSRRASLSSSTGCPTQTADDRVNNAYAELRPSRAGLLMVGLTSVASATADSSWSGSSSSPRSSTWLPCS